MDTVFEIRRRRAKYISAYRYRTVVGLVKLHPHRAMAWRAFLIHLPAVLLVTWFAVIGGNFKHTTNMDFAGE